jgi:hypothetical protein
MPYPVQISRVRSEVVSKAGSASAAPILYRGCARNDPPQHSNHLHKSRHNSTNMDSIQEAIEAIESREDGASFNYRQAAKQFGICHRTLARRHQGQTQPRHIAHLSLHPQHEMELI